MNDGLEDDVSLDDEEEPGPVEPQPETIAPVNLAELMSDAELTELGSKLKRLIDRDLQSRETWEGWAARGILAMGMLTEETADGRDGATGEKEDGRALETWQSRVVHPALSEAVIRFVSSAMKETFPPDGPAKPHVITPVSSDELLAQADRQSHYVNFLYTSDDAIPDAAEEYEKMLFACARDGDAFREPYWDYDIGAPDVATISVEDLIMPISARSVYKSPRVTHRMRRDIAWIRDWQDKGYFRPIEISVNGSDVRLESDKERDRILGRAESYTHDVDDDAAEVVIYKMTTRLQVDVDQDSGGKSAAYLIWLTDDGNVLAIYQDWESGGEITKRRWRYAQYPFLLVDGCVYGVGLYHIIGYLCETATDALRGLLDAAERQNKPSMLVGSDINLDIMEDKSGVAPGEWRQLPFAGIDFKNSIVPLTFSGPSSVLFQLLGSVVETAQRLASTADMMVGDAKNTGPVGTTIALIEQGSLVYNAIHARLHRSMRRELRLLCRVIYENVPDEAVYPYPVSEEIGASVPIKPDFDGRIDVEPVSDPRIFSKTQRLARAQALLQLANSAPQLYDMRKVHKQVLGGLEQDDIDTLLPKPERAQRMDAVSENMAMLNAKPVEVYPDQDHKAHAQIHAAVKTDPRFIALFSTLPPEMQAQVQARMVEHEAQHLAWDYKIGIMGQIGLMTGILPMNIPGLTASPEFVPQGEDETIPPPLHPPDVERKLDELAAAAVAVQQAQQQQMMMAQQMVEAAAVARDNGGNAPAKDTLQ